MKRIISISLALIMIFGIFTVTAVNAADVKILGDLSINVGETKPLKFTDPSGNEVSVIWESSKPEIATVTSDGKVTGKKAGTCVISTTWNSKVYGVNITVKAASSTTTKTTTTTSSKTANAYTKLKNYLTKNGKVTTVGGNTNYDASTKVKGNLLTVNYNTKPYFMYSDIYKSSKGDKGALYLTHNPSTNSDEAVFYWRYGYASSKYTANFKLSNYYIGKSLKFKHADGPKKSEMNKKANKALKKLLTKLNSYLKKKVKITVKSLGYKNKTKKKIALNKKSAKITKGKTLKLKLKNAKASKVKWSSSKKKVATVSKKGVVKAKKKGKATITAKYKGKKYKCKLTVKAKAKKKSLTVKQAFNKLKKYLMKNGKKTAVSDGTANLYKVYWKKKGFSYSLDYQDKLNDFRFQGDYETSSKCLSIDFYVDTKSKVVCYFDSIDYTDSTNDYYMAVTLTKKNFVLENIPDFQFNGGNYQNNYSTKNMNAKATLQWMFPDFNSYISKKAGVTMKQLGFKKWK